MSDYSALRLSLSERLPIVTYTNTTAPVAETVWMSPQAERLTGYSVDQWVRRPGFFEQVLHPDDREPVLEEMRALRTERRPFSRDYRLIGPGGRVIWIHDESVPIDDGEGRPELIQGYFVDITERKELEQQLLHAQKLEAVGRLAGGIAHDFNNFLTAIGGYARLALEAVPRRGPVRRWLEEIVRTVDAATRLTRQLLVFSRREPCAPKLVELVPVLGEMRPMLRRVAGDWIRLELLLEEAPVVHADPAQLEQVVVNLVANARDADAGSITVRTGRTFREGREHAFVAVSDDGHGMDEATREQALDPFFTTRPRGQGSGLGLSIVAGIADRCGGRVEIETAPDAGTTVTLLLPRAPLR